MRPAPDVSLIAPILLLRGVPARMPDVTIKVECNEGKGVTDIIRPEHGPPDQCLVVFEELKCVLYLCLAFTRGLVVGLRAASQGLKLLYELRRFSHYYKKRKACRYEGLRQ